MKKSFQIALLATLAVCMIFLSGCECKHEWSEASCTLPSTCSKCGEAEGEPLGHNMTPASCDATPVCSVCGHSQGDALGHDFIEYKLVDYTKAVEYRYSECSRCGEMSGKTQSNIKKLHNGTHFLFTPNQWYDRYSAILDDNSTLYVSGPINAEDTYVYGIYNSTYDSIGYARFYDEDVNSSHDPDDDNTGMIYIEFFTLDTDVIRAAVCAILSADPTLTYEEGWAILVSSFKDEGISNNGISYFGQEDGSTMQMGIIIG